MNFDQIDGSAPVEMYAEPERTSIAAILSLVLGLLGCCTGVTSIIGVPLAIFGIVGISRSKGRIGGMGIAIAGLLIGLLSLVIWIGLLFGSKWTFSNIFEKQIMQPTSQVIIDLQSGDFDAVRANLSSPAADATDEELIAFRDGYIGSLGNFVDKPTGWIEYFQGIQKASDGIQGYTPPPGSIPFGMEFDNGTAMVVPFMRQGSNGAYMPPEEITIVDLDGNVHTLPAD
jgi:hypothetical protein